MQINERDSIFDAPASVLYHLTTIGNARARKVLQLRGLIPKTREVFNTHAYLRKREFNETVNTPEEAFFNALTTVIKGLNEENDLEIGTDKLVYDRRSKTPGEVANRPIDYPACLKAFLSRKSALTEAEKYRAIGYFLKRAESSLKTEFHQQLVNKQLDEAWNLIETISKDKKKSKESGLVKVKKLMYQKGDTSQSPLSFSGLGSASNPQPDSSSASGFIWPDDFRKSY